MSRNLRKKAVTQALLRQKDRLTRHEGFSSFVLLIPFLAVVVLSLFTSLETNTRLVARGKPMEHVTEEIADHRLWLSISSVNGRLLVSSNDSSTFTWGETGPSEREYQQFKTYLKSRVGSLVIDAVRAGQIQAESLSASLAVDQTLTYQHVRPVIYALSEAGIARYGFETRIVR